MGYTMIAAASLQEPSGQDNLTFAQMAGVTAALITVAAALLYLAAALLYLLGLLALGWPIYRMIGDASTALFAVSLIPRTVVAGQVQPISEFGRVYAAYGGIFIALSLGWGIVVDGFRPDRWDLLGAAICIVGVFVMVAPPRG